MISPRPDFSLCALMALTLPAPEAITLAHRTGYQFAGLRLMPSAPGGVVHDLMNDAAQMRETLSRMKDTGVGVFDLEVIRIGPTCEAKSYEAFFEAAARLGGKAVVVVGEDEDENRLAASFAALCDVARPYGLSISLEFVPFFTVKDAATAKRVVAKAGAANGAVLVDPLHYIRSGTSLADVAAIPPTMLAFAQICDAPLEPPPTVEGLLHAARSDRLLPGDGGIDLVSLFAAMPDGLPIGIEIPNDAQVAAVGRETWARKCLEASKVTIRAAGAARKAM